VSAQIAAAARSWNNLLNEHLHVYTALFDRVKLDLGRSSSSALPTDARLIKVQSPSSPDPGLEAPLFQ